MEMLYSIAMFFGLVALLTSPMWLKKFLELTVPPITRLILSIVALTGTLCEPLLVRVGILKEDKGRLPFAYRIAGWRIGAPSPYDFGVFQTHILYYTTKRESVGFPSCATTMWDKLQ